MTKHTFVCSECSKETGLNVEYYKRYQENMKRWKAKPETKEKVRLYMRKYRLEHPEKIKELDRRGNEKQKESKVQCECGKTVYKYYLKKHLQTGIHQRYLERKINQDNEKTETKELNEITEKLEESVI